MKSLETLKLERLIRINLGSGMTLENATECAKNKIDIDNLQFNQKINRESKNEHNTKFDGTQIR